MNDSTFKIELNELIAQYEAGVYTRGELISIVIGLISESITDKNWSRLPKWLKNEIVEVMVRISESEEIMTFGHVEPFKVKQQNKLFLAWLKEKGYLNCF